MSLKDTIENHPVVILAIVLFTGFGLGAGSIEYLNQRDEKSAKAAEITLDEKIEKMARELNFEKSRADQLEEQRVGLQSERDIQVAALKQERVASRRLLSELQSLQLKVAKQIAEISTTSTQPQMADDVIRKLVQSEIIGFVEREAAAKGVPPFLGEGAVHIDTGELLQGNPQGGNNALIPKVRDDILKNIIDADGGTVANIIRDPIKCLTFQAQC